MKQKKGIYEGIRKPLTPPTKVFKDKKKESLLKADEITIEYPKCEVCKTTLFRLELFTDTGERCFECEDK